MTAVPSRPREIAGYGLVLRPWDDGMVRQMARWGEHGFPYHAFDLGFLRERFRAEMTLRKMRETDPHHHFVACVDGRAVGRVSVNMRDPAGLYLWSVHVPPEYEGQGVCRRMIAALISWLEVEVPGVPFVLTTNTFAEHAHRAYAALGFSVMDTRWQFDQEIAREMWKRPEEAHRSLAGHVRFQNGRWEVRAYVMSRQPGAPMDVRVGAAVRESVRL